ncbi:GNAT family N-acetyltransferase [Leisingera sp. ANG-Vp]|uniref:GNAT family N-acetyltransferase n=1 Tax=Leisingera sp. ANG-Vp TaxID=1577896 RepID=UPI000580AAE1|nr:GNAT family N-acetyltransferase [Leisingera sp. ANG-Vp]KIC15913.1 acetyltransferase [Leisingera sp. ANG-Vp]
MAASPDCGAAVFRIRQFKAEDAGALANVFHAAVHGIANRFYTPEQLSAWCPEVPSADAMCRKMSDGRAVWVAADCEDIPAAFIDLEADGHIDMLFCHPRAAGQGAGAALYARLEAAALRQGLGLLYVEASEAARGFFERMGFALDRRREFERGGVKIHNYRMVKILD